MSNETVNQLGVNNMGVPWATRNKTSRPVKHKEQRGVRMKTDGADVRVPTPEQRIPSEIRVSKTCS